MIKPGEIVHCNLTFVTKKKNTIIIKDTVFGRPYEGELQKIYNMNSSDDAMFLRRHKITEDVELTKIDVIKSLGFKVGDQSYSTASKGEGDERMANGAFM